MPTVIQVGNLPDSIDGPGLLRLFQAHGAVRSADIARHLETGRSTGVGFVEMESEEEGAAAIAALNHQECFGRVLSVCRSDISNDEIADGQQIFGPMNMTGNE
jgi:RNA recognition motif-containing protein